MIRSVAFVKYPVLRYRYFLKSKPKSGKMMRLYHFLRLQFVNISCPSTGAIKMDLLRQAQNKHLETAACFDPLNHKHDMYS